MTDLTGGISIQTKLNWNDPNKDELFRFLYENQKNVIVASTIDEDTAEIRQKNLVGGHLYSLVKLALVETSDGGRVRLLQLRNPWGNKEFNGDWSDRSAKWDLVDRKLLMKMLLQSVEGHHKNFKVIKFRAVGPRCRLLTVNISAKSSRAEPFSRFLNVNKTVNEGS